MKKLLFFLMLFFFTVSNAYAYKVSQIVKQPITNSDLSALKAMVKEHKHFSEADFRNLLRNYIGSVGTSISLGNSNSNIFSMMKSKAVATVNNSGYSICDKYRYFVKNGKVERVKISPICYSYFTGRQNKQSARQTATMLHFHYNGKALAMLVYNILNTYPNVKNNINSQGSNYQNALWIATDRGLFHTVYVILKYAPKVNPDITGISNYFAANGSCVSNRLFQCSYNFIIPHKWINNDSYVCQDLINAGGGTYNDTYGTVYSGLFAGSLSFFQADGVQALPFDALRLNSINAPAFDKIVFKKLFHETTFTFMGSLIGDNVYCHKGKRP